MKRTRAPKRKKGDRGKGGKGEESDPAYASAQIPRLVETAQVISCVFLTMSFRMEGGKTIHSRQVQQRSNL